LVLELFEKLPVRYLERISYVGFQEKMSPTLPSCNNNRKRQFSHLQSNGKNKTRFDFPQVGRAEEMLYDHCYVSNDFMNDLHQWGDAEFYQNNVHKMQLPYTPAPKAPPVDPEILRQRRQELAKRLVEINAKKREEKVIEINFVLKQFDQFMFRK
jgi:hypothetical protein